MLSPRCLRPLLKDTVAFLRALVIHSGPGATLAFELHIRTTRLLRNLYVGQEATVRTGHGTIDWFEIGKGVRQGVYCHPAYLTYMQSTS